MFAKTINCEQPTADHEACNQCESCCAFNEQRSYNIHELDAASNNGVDDIRSLNEQVRIPPQVGKYSVYIIDEVHMLSAGAFNAFLKTLEEPPAHAIFVLATTEKHKIIPTILSRCQIYDFNRITIFDTVEHLKYIANEENVTVDENALNIIAQKSDGAMRDALSIFDQLVSFSGNNITYQDTIENLNILDYEYYFKLVNAFLEGDITQSLLIFNEVLEKGFDAHHFITGLSSHLRDMLVCKDEATIQLLEVGADIGKKYQQQAQTASTNFLFLALNISNECDLNYRLSKNKRLLVELALIKMCQLSDVKKKTLDKSEAVGIKKIEVKEEQTENTQSVKKEIVQEKKVTEQTTTSQPVVTESSNSELKKEQSINRPKKKPLAHKSISISEKPKTIVREEKEKNIETEKTTISNEIVEIEKVIEAWNKYEQEFANDAAKKSLMKNHKPIDIVDNFIVVKVDNKFQEAELLNMDVINYLREQLNNSHLRFKVEINEADEMKKYLTPQELYKKMIEKEPLIEKLRKSLEMEID
ncbi:MAG: DNA polymerase III, subunit gamma and tau [Clostridiales bacterium]|nr:MAG: DNA polymerase III, subunit gamma and tau [Clostridiales bacterium]